MAQGSHGELERLNRAEPLFAFCGFQRVGLQHRKQSLENVFHVAFDMVRGANVFVDQFYSSHHQSE